MWKCESPELVAAARLKRFCRFLACQRRRSAALEPNFISFDSQRNALSTLRAFNFTLSPAAFEAVRASGSGRVRQDYLPRKHPPSPTCCPDITITRGNHRLSSKGRAHWLRVKGRGTRLVRRDGGSEERRGERCAASPRPSDRRTTARVVAREAVLPAFEAHRPALAPRPPRVAIARRGAHGRALFAGGGSAL